MGERRRGTLRSVQRTPWEEASPNSGSKVSSSDSVNWGSPTSPAGQATGWSVNTGPRNVYFLESMFVSPGLWLCWGDLVPASSICSLGG